jgi:hypothetical protein
LLRRHDVHRLHHWGLWAIEVRTSDSKFWPCSVSIVDEHLKRNITIKIEAQGKRKNLQVYVAVGSQRARCPRSCYACSQGQGNMFMLKKGKEECLEKGKALEL